MVLPKFAWIAEKTTCLAREACSAKCIIRVDCSPVGGLKGKMSPMQTKAFQVARGDTKVAQMSFASQVPLAWQSKRGSI
jgi:hypothetical protein